jgi:hypothetical protein
LHRNLKIEQHEPHSNPGWTHVLRKGKQLTLHMLHPSCYSCYQPCEQSRMKKGLDCDYETLNITMVICDTYILQRLTKFWWWPSNIWNDDYNFTTRNPNNISTQVWYIPFTDKRTCEL